MPAVDASPPLEQLSKGGWDVLTGVVTEIVATNAGRSLLDVMCDQPDGETPRARVWVSCGATAPLEGAGVFIRPDGCFSQWTADRCRVLADEDCRVTWVEWGVL